MSDFVVKTTNVWNYTNMNRQNTPRNYIRHCYPFIDHKRLYAYKPRGQRGAARTDQTFIVSFAHMSGVDSTDSSDFLQAVSDAGLSVCRYRTKWRGVDVYKIIVASKEVNVLHALELLGPDEEEDDENEPSIPKWSLLNHCFQHPNHTSDESNQMKTAAPRCLGNNLYQCPHCSWINFHAGEPRQGHRECDGPLESQVQCVPQAEPGWTGTRPLAEWQMYNCPGYTI